ncbi:hypothetical protein KR51_00005770 [Rubidibacter lacunae KORDI 51-2]|uniref:Beta-lactamase class A catalytic domain-containing protein n=1 Tax=Rubidibacter lacunae KORDI 51-2 TaxID=582515 RepID=U5DSR2_9CHRO|nr:serine hydrolase [Rubidibacter lacunae]ERN42730.1 hypothetical protein KR51_00005770 [Rubidibacter lacunae KORDI 51-2]
MSFYHSDALLDQLGADVLAAVWKEFPSLSKTHLALTWLVYDPPVVVNTGGALSAEEFWKHSMRGFCYRGVEPFYPASIVKLFYLVAAHEWLEQEMIPLSGELERALHDSIVFSYDDAAGLVVDALTGTTSGLELPPGPLETWAAQRNIVNRYYQSLGWEELKDINVNQKTWCDGPYGRERQFAGDLLENRNQLTTDAVARLLHAIAGGVAVSSARSQVMMQLLQRDLTRPEQYENHGENQIAGFLSESLPPTARVWSKGGWTRQVRHDAAYIELPDCRPYLLVVFARENKRSRQLIPFISQQVAVAMAGLDS